jgi:hypothetical protein
MLNEGEFPYYLMTGRLILLSKEENTSVVNIEDTRPIVVNSHITKIL